MKSKNKNVIISNQGVEQAAVKRKKKRKKAPVIIGIIIILFVVVRMVSCAFTPAQLAFVTTVTASKGDLQDNVSTSGTVESEEKKVIFSEVNGRIAQVNVQAGDAVASGDVLVSYDMEEMDKMLKQALLSQSKSDAAYKGAMSNNSENQAKLKEANTNLEILERQLTDYKAQLKKLQTELEDSQRTTGNGLAGESLNLSNQASKLEKELAALAPNSQEYADKVKQLEDIRGKQSENQYLQQIAGSTDYVAQKQREIEAVQEHITACEEYKAQMEAQKNTSEASIMDSYDKEQYDADNQMAAMSYEDAEADYNRAKAGVYAEFDGIVTECTVVPGATVTEGMQILTLENSSDVGVRFSVTKTDVAKLAVGQKVDVKIFDTVYEGEVSKINRMAEMNASGTPMVGAQVHIKNPDDKIILGLDAKLVIYTQSVEDALLIPVEAINADKDGDFLYVVENGVIVRKPIVCGISSDTYAEVLEGITETDQIVLSALTDIEEGMAVTAMPAH